MARPLAEQSALDLDHLGFEERLGLLVDRETTDRDGRLLAQRLLRAKLKPNTAAEDTDFRHARGLDKMLYQRLLAGQWLREKQNVLFTGKTGVGKNLAGLRLSPPGLPARLQRTLRAPAAAARRTEHRACGRPLRQA